MIRILFVCHGNICRSPMAEFVMKKIVEDAGRGDDFFIASAATSSEEVWNGVGNPVYPPARQELARHGIKDVSGKRAVQIEPDDYEKYDLIIGMEQINIRNMLRILGGDPEGKVRLLLEFAGDPRNISDPWYSGDFKTAYDDIYEGCLALFGKLTAGTEELNGKTRNPDSGR